MIELADLRARGTPTRGEPTPELRGANAKIDRGLTVLMGPRSGGGPLLLALLAGRVEPRAGTLTIAGHKPGAVEARVFHVPLAPELPDGLKVRECVQIALKSTGKTAKSGANAVSTLGLLGIEALENRLTSTLTPGEHRAVVLAAALACEPRVLLVEEPHASFDPRAQATLGKVLLAFAEKDATLIVTTQSPRDAARLGGRVLRVEHGVIADAPARAPQKGFLLACDRTKDLAAALAALPSVGELRTSGARVFVAGDDARVLAKDVGALVAKGAFAIHSFEPSDGYDPGHDVGGIADRADVRRVPERVAP